VTNERSLQGQSLSDKGDRFYLDPDKVRKVELLHQPPGRERVRVTVEYATGEVRVLTVHKSLLATVLEELYAAESATQRRGAKSEPDT
jgi:hypothetical protein